MLNKLKLSTKFTLLLLFVFVIGSVASSLVLWQALLQNVQTEIDTRGSILIETMSSVRAYTSNHIKPLLNQQIETQAQFIAETVPAFSAKTVFETFRTNPADAAFMYREATLNPTNLNDAADSFETAIIQQMRSQPDLKQTSGYRTLDNAQVYYIARPLAVTAASCLSCHSDPAKAPKSLITTYGATNGFGWKLNDIVGSQVIYVPADQVFSTAQHAFLLVMGIVIGVFALALLVINFLLRRYVLKPVSVLGNLAHAVSAEKIALADLDAPSLLKVTQRGDELGDLAQTFQRMVRTVYNREQEMKQQMLELHIEIDEMKQKKQVKEIVETDFFRDLQSKANLMRSRQIQRKDIPSQTTPAK